MVASWGYRRGWRNNSDPLRYKGKRLLYLAVVSRVRRVIPNLKSQNRTSESQPTYQGVILKVSKMILSNFLGVLDIFRGRTSSSSVPRTSDGWASPTIAFSSSLRGRERLGVTPFFLVVRVCAEVELSVMLLVRFRLLLPPPESESAKGAGAS